MRVLLLSDANSAHTIKWVVGLTNKGIDVCLWSFSAPKDNIYNHIKNLSIVHPGGNMNRNSYLAKAKYLFALSNLKKTIRKYKPDILHAHYASSYGLLGRLSKFHPFIISVWGSDIFVFPKKNFFFKEIIMGNFKSADVILSTSHVMAVETEKYTNKQIEVTPFGINLDIFTPQDHQGEGKVFTVGTVKALEDTYGIIYLIRAFDLFRKMFPGDRLKLLIVGGGSQEANYKSLVKDLNLEESCTFTGAVPYKDVPYYQSMLDVAVFLSDNESFGVSAIEAGALQKAVIVSNVGGLPEVVMDNVTGIVVPPQDPQAAADAMAELYLNPNLRKGMGIAGRERVKKMYNWEDNLDLMIKIYQKTSNASC